MNIDVRRWLALIAFAIVMTLAFRRPDARESGAPESSGNGGGGREIVTVRSAVTDS